jgi:endonuclease G
MAGKKRAKKKTTNRKRSHARSRAKQSTSVKSRLRAALVLTFLCIGAIAATYYWGSFELRNKMERAAMQSLNVLRSPDWMPRPITGLFNAAYDAIPGSQGLAVDAGELGHESSALIAGIPTAQTPIRVLHNESYINLFSEPTRQTTCIALKLSNTTPQKATIPTVFFEDPRIKQLRERDFSAAGLQAQPMAPPVALAETFGSVGANESHLVTNLVPMSTALSDGVWKALLRELTESYPQRFGEVWIYLGPITRNGSPTLPSGLPIPDAFYAIAFDLTDSGALRAIAFIVPQDASNPQLHTYISSIDSIEEQTGLEFLPDIDFHARQVLGAAMSQSLW